MEKVFVTQKQFLKHIIRNPLHVTCFELHVAFSAVTQKYACGTEQGTREEAHLLGLKIVTFKVGNLVVLHFFNVVSRYKNTTFKLRKEG